jgi:hypothetical protein
MASRWVIEEADQDRWLALATTQIPMQLIAKLGCRAGPPPAPGVPRTSAIEPAAWPKPSEA